MFISVFPGEQIEVLLTKDGLIEEYYVEITGQNKTKRNIYKGVIHNIDPSLQAAFVNYGEKKNGFLQIDEVHPEYYLSKTKAGRGQKYPPIQKVLRPGQELLVQVVKQPTGSKGAFLTTYLTLPGRFFVLTPGREQLAISRKIEDDQERARLKKIVTELKLDPGVGVILRTVSADQNKTNLYRDLQFLKRLWKDVRKKGMAAQAPSLIYEERDLAFRAVRDYLTADVAEIWVDDQTTAEQIEEVVVLLYPRRKKLVKKHLDSDRTLFERFNLKAQLQSIYNRRVPLPSGGELVFDSAEALTAVDINSGKIGGEKNFQEMALKTNLEAAKEIGHQLRLRDIGGQIVIDFIEMKDKKNCLQVERTLKTALKDDKARSTVGRISRFGLLEMVRQRMGSSAISTSFKTCPCCQGVGYVRNMEWLAQELLKKIYRQLSCKKSNTVLQLKVEANLALYLLNHKKERIRFLEEQFGVNINFEAKAGQN